MGDCASTNNLPDAPPDAEDNNRSLRIQKPERSDGDEYEDIEIEFSGNPRKCPEKYSIAMSKENRRKNRYNDIYPYNENLIDLKSKEYINASLMDLGDEDLCYISAQWPLHGQEFHNGVSTQNEWWSMVYEYDVRIILCLQKPGVSRKGYPHEYYHPVDKSAQFMTKNWCILTENVTKTKSFDEYTCSLIKKDRMKEYVETRNKEEFKVKTVSILFFNEWPDRKVPKSTSSLKRCFDRIEQIIRQPGIRNNRQKEKKVKIKHKKPNEKPCVLVHCSAGVGRSGVAILTHHIIRNSKSVHKVGDTLRLMRSFRNNMVQNREQYDFCRRFVKKYSKSAKI